MVAGLGRKSNLPPQFRTTRLRKDFIRSDRPRLADVHANDPPAEAARSPSIAPTSVPSTLSPPTNNSFRMAQRRYVVRPQICHSNSSHHSSDETEEELTVSGILDGITRLCLGSTLPTDSMDGPSRGGGGLCRRRRELTKPTPRNASQRMSSSAAAAAAKKKTVVYPIASYPARLNCQKLVSERRQVFQQNLFRPVSNDEMSHYQTSRRDQTA